MSNNIKTIVAIEHDGLKTRAMTINIKILNETTADTFDIIKAVKYAVHDYLCTNEGWNVYLANCHNFNWADVNDHLPNEFCREYGFEKIDCEFSDIEVDWDEHLADDENLSIFWESND